MRLTLLALMALLCSGCLKQEIARSAATIVEMAKAQQDEKADLTTCKKLAGGIQVLGDAIHKSTDQTQKPVVTAEEAVQNPDRSVGKCEAQAERTLTAYRFEQMAWDLAYWLGGLAASALTAATGIKFTSIINTWRKAKKVLNGTVSAIQSCRTDHPELKGTIDSYLEAAHDKIGKMAHTYIAHEKANGIQPIQPKAVVGPAPPRS